MAELELALLGGVRVLLDGTPVRGFVSLKAQALLCYLALSGRPHLRTHLSALFWGDQPDALAASSLRQALSNLRRLLGPFLLIARDTAAINPTAGVRIDVARFERAMLAGGAGALDLAELSA